MLDAPTSETNFSKTSIDQAKAIHGESLSNLNNQITFVEITAHCAVHISPYLFGETLYKKNVHVSLQSGQRK